MIKCNKNNVTHDKTLYKPWPPLIISILVEKNLTYFFKWKSVMEMDVITKSTNLHVYRRFSYIDN